MAQNPPVQYQISGVLMVVSGMFNGFLSLLYIALFIWVCIGVFWFVTAAMGAWQAFIGWQMYNGQVSPQAKMSTMVGIGGGLLSFNIFAIGASVFGFMQLGDDEVVGWLEQNGVA